MKRFSALFLAFAVIIPFFAGCEKKKAEVKTETTTTTPEGTTKETDTHAVESDKK